MEKYGGKFQKKREETRARHLREKDSLVKKICIYGSLAIWISVGTFLGVKYKAVHSWNQDVIYKTRATWKALDFIESDIVNATLFLKGCRRDMVFQETPDGFDLHIVELRNQSMEVLQNVPSYSDSATAAYLGSSVRPGDKLVLCNSEEEKVVELQVIRNNPKYAFHYLIFPEKISLTNPELPSNLIKFSKVNYKWEKVSEGNERLMRTFEGQTNEVISNIKAHQINYSLKDDDQSHFTLDLTLNETFQDGQPIQVRRIVPLRSFQRLPSELEAVIP
jgi:hypothetical protein